MSAATGTFELFTSAVSAGDLRVVDWRCVESIGEPFRLELNARCAEAAAEEIVQALLGQPATFVMRTPAGGARARRGVVIEAQVNDPSSSDFAGSELGGGGRGSVRIVVAPRLALMAMKQHSRIFQGLTTEEIIRSVLEPWHLDARFQLAGSYQARAYCTQYRESDLAFLERICAREGFGFFLEHRAADDEERDSPGAETIVFHDEAHFYLEIPAPELGATGTVLEHATGRFGEAEHEIGSFGLNRTVRPELVRLGDFDFRRPGLALAAMSGLNEDERSPIGNELGGEQIAAYFHADRGELEGEGAATEIDEAVAKIRLEQLRQQAVTGRGRSRCQRLAPGYVFTLDRHPHGGLNGGYVVTRIEHRGRIPEATAEGEEHYDNHFSCVPSSTMWRPPAQSAPVQQAMETAVVVGPKDEEVHVDEHGRVKVQFHWDLEGKHDEHSSCWLRVTQPWAGANWGAQFLPRIGAEVLVGFVGGDVDRPIVMGSLYNGTRPTPFRLPAEINKAGFRSQSTPGGEGYSELTFDDQKGRERMILRAERHLEQRVGHDLQIDVGGTEKVTVTGKSERTIAGDMTTTVNGERKDELAKSYQVLVKGSHAVGIDGDAETRISGNRVTRIEGRDEIELAEAKADLPRQSHQPRARPPRDRGRPARRAKERHDARGGELVALDDRDDRDQLGQGDRAPGGRQQPAAHARRHRAGHQEGRAARRGGAARGQGHLRRLRGKADRAQRRAGDGPRQREGDAQRKGGPADPRPQCASRRCRGEAQLLAGARKGGRATRVRAAEEDHHLAQ